MKYLTIVKATVLTSLKKLKQEGNQNLPYDFLENFCFFASYFWSVKVLGKTCQVLCSDSK